MSSSNLTVKLGAQELLFLLSTLHIQLFPNLGQGLMQELGEVQAAQVFSAGINSLRARDWLEVNPEDRTIVINSILLGLLGTCALAKQLLLVKHQVVGYPEQTSCIYVGKDLTTIHESNEPGIHQFTGIIEQQEVMSYISARLNLSPTSSQIGQGLQLTEAVFAGITQAISNQRILEATAILRAESISADIADQFIEFLCSVEAVALFAALQIDAESASPYINTFALLESSTGFWVLQPHMQEKEIQNLYLAPTSLDDCMRQVQAAIEPIYSAVQ
jgi:hypothetical protein